MKKKPVRCAILDCKDRTEKCNDIFANIPLPCSLSFVPENNDEVKKHE